MPPYYPIYFYSFVPLEPVIFVSILLTVLVALQWQARGWQATQLSGTAICVVVAGAYYLLLLSPLLFFSPEFSFANADDVNFVASAVTVARGNAIFLDQIPGGADFYSLIGSHELSLARVYGLLPPHQIIPLVAIVNLILATVFSWKILRENLGLGKAASLVGALFVGFAQGYWQGTLGESHASFLHGLALIPFVLWTVERHFEKRTYLLAAAISGVIVGVGSTLVFYVLASLLTSVFIWICFRHPREIVRLLLVLVVLSIFACFVQAEYLLGVFRAFESSLRAGHVHLSVPAADYKFVPLAAMLCLAMILIVLIGRRLGVKVDAAHPIIVVVSLVVVPLILHEVQALGFTFRLRHFYHGIFVPWFFSLIYLADSVAKMVAMRWPLIGRATAACLLSLGINALGYLAVTSLNFDIAFGHPVGGWRAATSWPAKDLQNGGVAWRTLSVGGEPGIHMGPWLKGVPSVTGYYQLINRNFLEFWNQVLAKGPDAKGTPGYVVVGQVEEGIGSIDLDAAALIGVRYIWSRVALNDPRLRLLYHQSGYGRGNTCAQGRDGWSLYALNGLPETIDHWRCVLSARGGLAQANIYELSTARPLVFVPKAMRVRPRGLEFAETDARRFAIHGNAIVTGTTEVEKDVSAAQIELLSSNAGHIVARVTASQETYVIVNVTDNGFWYVTVDNVPHAYERVNLAQIGIAIPGGEHELLVQYCPRWPWQSPTTCQRASENLGEGVSAI